MKTGEATSQDISLLTRTHTHAHTGHSLTHFQLGVQARVRACLFRFVDLYTLKKKKKKKKTLEQLRILSPPPPLRQPSHTLLPCKVKNERKKKKGWQKMAPAACISRRNNFQDETQLRSGSDAPSVTVSTMSSYSTKESKNKTTPRNIRATKPKKKKNLNARSPGLTVHRLTSAHSKLRFSLLYRIHKRTWETGVVVTENIVQRFRHLVHAVGS